MRAFFKSIVQNRKYKYKFYKWWPPQGCEPWSLGAISRCHYATTPNQKRTIKMEGFDYQITPDQWRRGLFLGLNRSLRSHHFRGVGRWCR